MKHPIIQLEDVCKKYTLPNKQPLVAIDHISLEIAKGQIVGIIGPSGAGKSTLLRCLNALEKPDRGKIIYDGVNLSKVSNKKLLLIRSQIGMIFQHFNLLARRTVLENVCLPLELARQPKTVIAQRAKECLKLVNLESHANVYPNKLSGGQKQRVAIARALANKTHVLLCDEATSALDPETTSEILHLLRELNERLGITLVLITHEISVIREICDTVFVMQSGKMVEHGPVEKIFSTPSHAVTRTFIQSLINSKIPDIIREQLKQEPLPKTSESLQLVLRLVFTGNTAQKPIIANFIHEYKININIVAGYIDHIGQSTFGTLIITLPNRTENVEKVIHFLKKEGIQIEQLGYIDCI